MNWPESTLGSHVELISGPAFKSDYFTSEPSDIPLIKGENIGQGVIRWEKSKYWPRDDVDNYRRFALRPGDVVLAMDRPWVTAGLKYAVISESDPESLLVQRVARIRGRNKLCSGFLRYIIASPEFSAYAKSIMGGTNVPHISGDQIRAFRFRLPGVEEQLSIAAVLSAYDDLIDNNRRRIELLEQAARLLYKEWFVHLRFPGHEHITITNGVPEGWARRNLTDLADSISYGFTASSTQEDIGPKFLRITDIVSTMLDWEDVPFCEATQKDIERNRLQAGDVVVARTGATVGYAKLISCVPNDAVFASYLVRFRFGSPKISLIAGVFMESDMYKDHVRNHAGGAAQPNANAKVLGSAMVLIPTPLLQEQFRETVAALICQRDNLIRQNARLARARDLLLPRLMNGEFEV